MPPAAIFNRYFVEHREWVVRQRYVGCENLGELARRPEFGGPIAQLLADLRDLINADLDRQRGRIRVQGVIPQLYFDYINVNDSPSLDKTFPPCSNAIAFSSGGLYFIGITVPLIQELWVKRRMIQMIVQKAAEAAGITNPYSGAKHISPHVFRHSIARHLKSAGYAAEFIQKFLGHQSIKTTMDTRMAPSASTRCNNRSHRRQETTHSSGTRRAPGQSSTTKEDRQ